MDVATLDPDFEAIFENPSREKLMALTWPQFEDFVQHVFVCAGYFVEKVAHRHQKYYVDLHLRRTGPRGAVVARVEVRRYTTALIIQGAVMKFLGALHLEGPGKGFIVTTSDFTGPAYRAANLSHGKVTLINGERLLRYITYIGGSRETGQFAGARIGPPEPTTPLCITKADTYSEHLKKTDTSSRVLTLSNNKGGVAKTTTALNVGFALADPQQHNKRVLLIDMDSQANLTKSLPAPSDNDEERPDETATIADYFAGRQDLREIIRPTRFSNLYLVPGYPFLQRLDSGGYARPDAELKFAEDVHALTMEGTDGQRLSFDWIVIDTPPAQGHFTRSALVAADFIIIPAFAEQYAADGIRTHRKTIRTMRALIGRMDEWSRPVLGCVITRWKPSQMANTTSQQLETQLPNQGIRVFRTRIEADDRIEQAHLNTIQGQRRNIFRLTNRPGPAARTYDQFVKEMLQYAKVRES